MNVNELINVVKLGYKVQRPVLAMSSPGLGKSSAMYQAASQLSAEYGSTFGMVEIRAASSNPSDLADVKYVVDGVVHDAPQAWFPTEEKIDSGRCQECGIIFLDEIADGTPAVQSVLQRLLLDRKLGSLTLAPSWGTVAASNRQADKAAAGRISTALINRCITVTVEADTSAFVQWGLTHDIAPEILAYVRWRPSCWNFDPKMRNANPAFCSPRSMHILSDVLKAMPNASLEIIAGIVGDGVGAEFYGFRDIVNELPDLDKIIKNPDKVAAPKKVDVAIATIYALMSRINEDNADNILKFYARLDPEIAITGVRDLLVNHRDLVTQQPAFRTWASSKTITTLLIN